MDIDTVFAGNTALADGLIERVARRSARYAGIECSEEVVRIVRSVESDMLDELAGGDPGAADDYLANWEGEVRTRAMCPVAASAAKPFVRCPRSLARHAHAIRAAALDPGSF
jgi:hypothetical protein